MVQRLVLTATVFVALAGCEKSSTPTTPPPGDTAGAVGGDDGAAADGGDTEPGAPSVAWADKSFDQRKEWMGVEVYPKMKAAFREYDANEFKSFTCETCHGDDGKEKKYEMPTDSIYPLPAEGYIEAAMAYDEKVTKFMVDKVVPDVAAMLNMEADTTGSGQGFGCLSCHPTE
jgi:hypothetical protein